MTESASGETVRALIRGLKVIEAFGSESRPMTLADNARAAGLNRATARRLLATLTELGYVTFDGKRYSLAPKVLTLSYPFLASFANTDMLMPFMEEMLEGSTAISSSASMLDDTYAIYIAGVPAKSHYSTWMTVGTRVPAYAAAMGRVLLSQMSSEQAEAILARSSPRSLTPHTLTDMDAIRTLLATAKQDGFAVCDRELDVTIRSCAVPVLTRDGRCWAAISASCLDPGRSLEEFVHEFVPKLRITASKISSNLPLSARGFE